jgi:putative ABC transport system substrate-binding protein
MKRRDFIVVVGSVAVWPAVARPQQAMPVIGFFHFDTPAAGPRIAAFREGLRDAGYVDGKNVIIDFRTATNPDQFQQIANQLVAAKVDLIVAAGSEAVSAAQRATQTIPIVMTTASDPLGTGFVKSLARPGGNITGLSMLNPELAGKRLELLGEMVSDVSPAMVLWSTKDPPAEISFNETEKAAKSVGVQIVSTPIQRPDQIESAFTKAPNAKTLIVLPAPVMGANAVLIAGHALKRRLPSISNDPIITRAGGLLSYGPSFVELYRQSALYVAKILAGAKAADLPVQQPTKFELAINLATAKVLGLTIPSMLLARADEVIE